MRLAGRTDTNGTTPGVAGFDLNVKQVARFNLPQIGTISKASVYLDGLGPGAGTQVCRFVIYSATDALIAVSDEVTVANDQQPGWVDFTFSAYAGALVMQPGDFFGGIHAGPYTDVIRLYYSQAAHGMGSKWNVDSYADGASATFGVATAQPNDFAAYIAHFSANAVLIPDETDMYFSRLPYVPSQRIFGQGGPEMGSTRLVAVGWHDTFIDPETGANALVRDGSDLADMLLGQRIMVTTQGVAMPRSTFAYVSNLADADAFDWDLSLARHSFAQIALLAEETIPTIVDVIS